MSQYPSVWPHVRTLRYLNTARTDPYAKTLSTIQVLKLCIIGFAYCDTASHITQKAYAGVCKRSLKQHAEIHHKIKAVPHHNLVGTMPP